MAGRKKKLDFATLVASIRQVHDQCAAQAGKAVNLSLTLRNWVIGNFIEVYERAGVDRAEYGDRLMDELADTLQKQGFGRCDRRELYRYRQFSLTYPQIVETVSPQLLLNFPMDSIGRTAGKHERISHSLIVETLSPQLSVDARTLVSHLSFSHLIELTAIDDALKRAFYEVECIRGNWSVRELRRQIGSLYFERSGLSLDKDKLAEITQSTAEKAEPRLEIRDPYVFEFLGIKSREVMQESDLEDALLDKLQDFLLELGHGFCFEARQKRILIGESYGFVDLVFYHRILKCHVLVELKVQAFTHESLGQLSTYVSWYKKNMMADGDNPPVGILLCAKKDHALVEYALAPIDNALFVSKYQLVLPNKEDIRRFIEEKVREAGGDAG